MTRVEQVTGINISLDFDKKIDKIELAEILRQDLKVENKANPFISKINGKTINLLVKQITYLGNPHPIFKKRIQISKNWNNLLSQEDTYLLGLYKYCDNIIYTLFDKANFVNRNTNNSSAHVLSIDLLKANELGIYTKTDSRKNIITCVTRSKILEFLSKVVKKESILPKHYSLFQEFQYSLPKNIHGTKAYAEMINSKYRNAFQAEWAGFYIEYKFERYLSENNHTTFCSFFHGKKKDVIDLDLKIENFYGDLKTHSNGSSAILGNDLSNILSAIKKHGKIWYIIFNHDTEKDSEHNYEVTRFWNLEQGKDDLMSYSKRMKNNVTFTDFQILEINNHNIKYLSEFKQGINSNGKLRNPKIKISKKYISNFIIYSSQIC